MISRNCFMSTMLCAMMFIAAAATVSAQVVFTNPPCQDVLVTNTTNCMAEFNFSTTGPVPSPVIVPPGATLLIPVGGPLVINGIISLGGTFHPFNLPPHPLGINCGPNEWWISNVTLGPPPGCCFDICADPCNCRITLRHSFVPPPCNP